MTASVWVQRRTAPCAVGLPVPGAAGGVLRPSAGTTVARVAQEVGCESEAVFARAFKRLMGQPPAARRAQAA
jgi:AraC-like DNA-binding protein